MNMYWSCMMDRVDVYLKQNINTVWAEHSGEVNGKSEIFKNAFIYTFKYELPTPPDNTCNTSFAKLTDWLLDTKHHIITQIFLIGSCQWSIWGQTQDLHHHYELFPLCFKMAENFENSYNIFSDWAKKQVQNSLVGVLNRYEKQGRRFRKPSVPL